MNVVKAIKKNLTPMPGETLSIPTTSLTTMASRTIKQPSKTPKETMYMAKPAKLVI